MAPLEDDLTPEQKTSVVLAQQDDFQERELLKIKVNAAIAAAPVAFTIAWGILYLAHAAGTPEQWLTIFVAPIISTALTNLGSSVIQYRRRKKAQQGKS